MYLEEVIQLKPNSNKRVLFMCDDCKETFSRQFQLLNRRKEHRCFSCARKHIGKTMKKENIIEASRTRCGSKHPRWNPNVEEFKRYKNKVHYLTMQNYRRYQNVINPDGHPRTVCGIENGYQLDHKISVKEGFENKIPAEIISDMSNLQIIPWKENRSKGIKRGV